jgi:hypothetical protein
MSNATRQEFNNIFKKETTSPAEFLDKMRLLIIYVLCTSDLSDVKSICDLMR